MEEGRDDEGAKPDSRPGRVDSLANFQIYTLAVRSRAGCFEEREGRKGAASGHWTGTMVGILLGFLHAHNARFSSRARVCACHCLQELASLSPLSRVGQVSRRANRLKVRSPGFEWDDFCEKSPTLRFPAI